MAVFALADLHLSHGGKKPMDVFGPEWTGHPEKIAARWCEVVGSEDLVIVPGDISWAMRLEEVGPDLSFVAALPGTKLLLRGNHDYWWSAIGKVRRALPAGIHALQNDHFIWQDWAICGTRGWVCPGDENYNPEEDGRIYRRETERLKLSLESALEDGHTRIIAALHYPPFNRLREPSAFTDLLETVPVERCVFGHIHGPGRERVFSGILRGVGYSFVAADAVNFTPVRIT